MRKRRTGGCLLVILLLAVGVLLCFGPVKNMVLQYLYPCKYTQLVEDAAAEWAVPPSLVYAVIKNESSFRPDAVSSVDARGLMQLTDETFQWVQARMGDEGDSFEDMFDPEHNIRYGTHLLSALLREFGSTKNALCAYHAGWGNAKKWLADPACSPDGKNIETIPFADTRYYVEKVLNTQKQYQELYSIP